MQPFKKLIDLISLQGVDGNLPQGETKRIIVTNRLSVLCVFFTLPYIIGFFYTGYALIGFMLCFFSLIYLSPLLVNHFRLYIAAKLILYTTITLHHFVLASVFGEAAGIHILYIGLILIPVAFFNYKKQLGWIIFCIVITVIATLVLYATHFSLFLIYDVPQTVIRALNIAFKITTIIGSVVILLSILMVSDKAEKVLDESNLFLQSQLRAIFDNSLDALFLVDVDKRKIIKANSRAVEMFEKENESDFYELTGLYLHKQKVTREEQEYIQNELKSKNMFEDEVLYITSKGKEFWGSLAIRRINISGKDFLSVRITDISEQKKSRQNTASALHEKEVLLAEIHHRVKNNLAVINGLLGLQAGYVEDEKAKQLFEESRNRIRSMALIHDKLYNNESLSQIEFCVYINDLVKHIQNSHILENTEVSFSVTCSDIFLDIKNAVPCGLILNELISNSYKHAFIGRAKGEIKIACSIMSERFTMSVSDDGIGFDPEALSKKPKTLGLTIIEALIDQLGGKVKTSNKNGTAYFISYEV